MSDDTTQKPVTSAAPTNIVKLAVSEETGEVALVFVAPDGSGVRYTFEPDTAERVASDIVLHVALGRAIRDGVKFPPEFWTSFENAAVERG